MTLNPIHGPESLPPGRKRGAEAIRSSRPFTGTLVNVRVDEFEQNGKPIRREVVEHPGAVAIIAVTTNQEVVLVRQWRHAIGAWILELPAGLPDHPGEDPIDTAKRELREETGYTAEEIWPVAVLASSPGFTDERVNLFCAVGCLPGEDSPDGEEEIEIVLASPEEALGILTRDDQLVDAATFGGLAWFTVHWPELKSS